MMYARFWARRFALVFAIATVLLALVDWLRHGGDAGYLEAIGWAAAAAAVAASIATRHAWKHGCRIARPRRDA